MATLITDPVVFYENNDTTLRFVVFQSDGGPALDISSGGVQLEFILKADADATDASGTTLTTVAGAITVTGVGSGQVAIPRAALATPGTRFVRLDVIDGLGKRKTAFYKPNAEIVNL